MKKDDHKLNDDKLVAHVCDALDDSVNRIDAETSQRIIAARKEALVKAPKHLSLPKFFAAAATVLTIFVAVVIVNMLLNQPLATDEVEAIELVAAQDTLELYEELEFYTWLVEEDITS